MSDFLPLPCFVLNEQALIDNAQKIKTVANRAKVEIILALKGFAFWHAFPSLLPFIQGATASSLHEVILCNEYMKCKSHTYLVVYQAEEIQDILSRSSHITFNSLGQLKKYGGKAYAANVSIGLRINPEYSDVENSLYNPATIDSRLGISSDLLQETLPNHVEGLHYHVHCESDSYALEKSLMAVEEKFGHLLPQIKWLNVGGGHLITKEDYDTKHLIYILKNFKKTHNIDLILEPGSAFGWKAGSLKTKVIDIIHHRNMTKTAIINASFTCHMPDCLEIPYRPILENGYTDASKGKYSYRLGGMSCLASDFLDAYSFDKELKINDQIEFLDMMHYTMVKTNTFNGIQLPAIAIQHTDGKIEVVHKFSYDDYKNRLS